MVRCEELDVTPPPGAPSSMGFRLPAEFRIIRDHEEVLSEIYSPDSSLDGGDFCQFVYSAGILPER